MRTLQIQRIKQGEQFKPIARQYAKYTNSPSHITGIKIKCTIPIAKGHKWIGCITQEGENYNMLDTDKVIRW